MWSFIAASTAVAASPQDMLQGCVGLCCAVKVGIHALCLGCWRPLLPSDRKALYPGRPRHAASSAGAAGRHADGYSSDEDDRQEGPEEDGTVDEYLCAKMHLVDLAGSERVKRTKAEGQRLKEGENMDSQVAVLLTIFAGVSSCLTMAH